VKPITRPTTPSRSTMTFRTLAFALVLALMASPIGCESDDGGGGGSNSGADVQAGDADLSGDTSLTETTDGDATGAETGDTQTTDWGEFDECIYTGTVIDAAGAPVVGLPVVICSEESPFCGSGKTKDDGRWQVSGLDRIPLGAKVLGALSDMNSVTIPLGACSQPSTDIGTVTLSALAAGELVAAETGGSVAAHPDLQLELPAGLGFPNYETETAVRAAKIDPSAIHPYILAEITPRAVFAIAPYDTETPSPVAFEAKLPELEGDVSVYVLDHLTGHPHKVCDTEVIDGSVTCPDAGLPELTWVIFE
jgi:hypothetical protein